MDTDEFWQMIDSVHREAGSDMDRKCELLHDRLGALSEQDLRDFIDHFDTADAGAYTWPLWGAAYVMRGGCSDDSFADFRATLISHGRQTYEDVLVDPETLADLDLGDEKDLCYEGFQYVKNDVAEEKLGEIPERGAPFPDEPSGEEWDEDRVMDLYPRLAAKFAFTDEGSRDNPSAKPWWKFW